MIKSGRYTIYNNKEYKLIGDREGNTLLLTKDKDQTDDSFEDTYNSGVYTKQINKTDLDEIYDIMTKAKYHGGIAQIIGEEGNKYFLATTDAKVAKNLNFEMTRPGEYGSWINKDEIEVFEEKKMLTNNKKKSKELER
ncbi:hypothetical protein HCA54_02520 [Listeria welshimeri]|nr:hypothetical protein [Listeria welshimeri]